MRDKEVDAFTDVLVRWLLLLGMVDGRKQKVYDDIFHELEALAMKDDKLQQAFDAWAELSQTPETAIAYEARLKFIIDEEAKIDAAKYYGKKEGLEEGKGEGEREKARQVILTGAQNGVPLETLALLTGYSLDEVETIITQAAEK